MNNSKREMLHEALSSVIDQATQQIQEGASKLLEEYRHGLEIRRALHDNDEFIPLGIGTRVKGASIEVYWFENLPGGRKKSVSKKGRDYSLTVLRGRVPWRFGDLTDHVELRARHLRDANSRLVQMRLDLRVLQSRLKSFDLDPWPFQERAMTRDEITFQRLEDRYNTPPENRS